MAIAYIGGATAAGPNSGTTSAIDTTGANLLVAAISSFTSSTSAVLSDSKGNTWTPLTLVSSKFRLHYCASPVVGSGHTFTVTNAAQYSAIAVQAFSGVGAAPFDQETTNVFNGTVALTPSQAGSVVITGSHCAGGTLSVDLGYTATIMPFVGGNNMGVGIAHLIQTTAASTAPTWANGGPVALASFRPAASGGPFPFHIISSQSGGANRMGGGL